jgi:hypothetical protein
MKKSLLIAIAITSLTSVWGQASKDARPAVLEDRASFSPSTKRDSLFFLPTKEVQAAPTTDQTIIGVGEMIVKFIRPKGIILGKTEGSNRIFIGARFYEKGDIVALEVPLTKDVHYERQTVELTVGRVGETFVELMDTLKHDSYRVPFSFRPNTRSTLKDVTDDGARVRFVGKTKDAVDFEKP